MGEVIDLTKWARARAAKRLGCLKELAASAMGLSEREFELFVSSTMLLTESKLELIVAFYGALQNPNPTDWETIKKAWKLTD